MNEPSRRRFIATTGGILAAAAAGVGPLIWTSRTRAADVPAKKVGFAIVGLGRFGAGQLLRSMPECKYARPVALVSGHPDKAKKLAAQYGVSEKAIYNYENFDSIKDNPEVDVVYVVLPNSMHCEYTVRAAKAGKHVMCEKPMAVSVSECQQMVDACKGANRKLAIGYRLRHEPYNQKAIELVQTKKYGPARIIESAHSFNIGPNEWRADKALAGGGPVMDLGIYCINASRYLTGEEPTHVSAQTYTPEGDARFKNVDGQMVFSLKFPSGVLSNCTTSYMHHYLGYARVMAEQAEILLQPAFSYGGLKLHVRARQGEEDINLPDVNQFASEMDHFARCVLDNKQPVTPGEEGLKDMKVIEALYKSAGSGKVTEV
jgi:predicted dehydrogenase